MPINMALISLSSGLIFSTLMSAQWKSEKIQTVNGYGGIPGRYGHLKYVLLGPKTIIW